MTTYNIVITISDYSHFKSARLYAFRCLWSGRKCGWKLCPDSPFDKCRRVYNPWWLRGIISIFKYSVHNAQWRHPVSVIKKHLMLCRETTFFFWERPSSFSSSSSSSSSAVQPWVDLGHLSESDTKLKCSLWAESIILGLNLEVSKVTTGLSRPYRLTISAVWKKAYCNTVEQNISSLRTNVLCVLEDRVLLR